MSDWRNDDLDEAVEPEETTPPSPPAPAASEPQQEPVPIEDTIGEPDAGDEVAADLDAFVSLAAERDEYLDALRRTQADFENYRKRVQREAAEARDVGAASLAGKLIDVLDTVDLALAHDPSDSVAQIATAIAQEINAPVDEDLVWLGVEQLSKAHLLREQAGISGLSLSRREVIRRIGVTAAIALPVVTSIVAPTASQAANCRTAGQMCTTGPQCCSTICNGGLCT